MQCREQITAISAARIASTTVTRGLFHCRPVVLVGSPQGLTVAVVPGGGHIAAVYPSGRDDLNPLWVPSWTTSDPSLARVPTADNDGSLEGQILSSIMGHSLCCDVFGAHSAGETQRSGLAFHGEAAQVTWCVARGEGVPRGCLASGCTQLDPVVCRPHRRFPLVLATRSCVCAVLG